MYRVYLLVKWWIHHAFEIKRLNVVLEFIEEKYPEDSDNETDRKTRAKKIGESMTAIETNEESIEAIKSILFG